MNKKLIDYIREESQCNYVDIDDYFKDLDQCNDEFKTKYLIELFLYIHQQEIQESNMVTIVNESDNFNKCPICDGELYGTYEINREAKDGEDPRIYGVICSNCSYENYD